jgi:hypothetical protein
MFNIPGKKNEEFYSLYEEHRMYVSATNVFFKNIHLLNTTKPKYITRDDFKENYKNILDDIKNESSPIDVIIPNDTEYPEDENGNPIIPEDAPIFIVNQLVPEYVTIKARIEAEDMASVLGDTHAAVMAVKDNPNNMSKVIDEIFIQWLVFKYLENIEKLHLQTLSNYTPVIEWVVENIKEKELKNYLTSKRINEDKFKAKSHEFIFFPNLKRMKQFYEQEHETCPAFDVENLMKRLVTNEVIKSDIYVVTAIYLALSFAMSDIYTQHVDESPCAEYVRDILSKL